MSKVRAVAPARTGNVMAIAIEGLSRIRRFIVVVILLVGAGALAAVVAPTVPATFCTSSGCYTTLDKAEAAMRDAPAYAGVGHLLEHMRTTKMNATTVRMQYWLRDRPAETIRAPSYYSSYGPTSAAVRRATIRTHCRGGARTSRRWSISRSRASRTHGHVWVAPSPAMR